MAEGRPQIYQYIQGLPAIYKRDDVPDLPEEKNGA